MWFWIAELVLIGLGLVIPLTQDPYMINPNTGSKMKSRKTYPIMIPTNPDMLFSEFEKGDFSQISPLEIDWANLPGDKRRRGSFIPSGQLELFRDRSNHSIYAISISLGGFKLDSDGDWEDSFDDPIIKGLLINEDAKEEIMQKL